MSETEDTSTASESEGASEQATTDASADDRSFTQEDIDRIVQQRLAKERAKFSDYDELKAQAERLAEIEDANRSDTERAIAEARAEGAREAQSKIADRLVRAEIRIAAAGQVAPEAINDLPALMGELAQFADDAGEIDTDRITAAIAELVETKPYLSPRVADAKSAPDPDQGAAGGGGAQLTAEQLKSMSPEEAYAAFREGRASAVFGS